MGKGQILVLGLVLALLPAAAAVQGPGDDDDMAGCYIDGRRGIVDCRDQGGQGATESKESFWTSPVAQALYGLLGLAASGGAFILGWNRVRQRRRSMHQLLSDVETTYQSSADEPAAGIEHLVGIRGEIKIRHANGKLGDSQFLALENKLAAYLARLRVLEIEQKFPKLPQNLLTEIRSVVEDAHLSLPDVARIENYAKELRVAPATRRELAEHLRRWATSDARPPAAEVTIEVAAAN